MLTIMPNIETTFNFLDTLNKAHSSVKFTMETECNGMLPFLCIQLLNQSPQIETKVYVKPTNPGVLLHYQSHVDNRYKKGLQRTMLDRAHRLSIHLRPIFPTNVTFWKQYSHGWSIPNIYHQKFRWLEGLRPAAAFITISRDRWHDSSGFTI